MVVKRGLVGNQRRRRPRNPGPVGNRRIASRKLLLESLEDRRLLAGAGPPEVLSVERADANPNNATSLNFTVTFDEPVTGAGNTENYNIGFVDVTDRPYPELVNAARETHRRLLEVHSGTLPPFDRRPKASEAGTPSYRLSDSF